MEGGGRKSLYRPHEDGFSGVHRIVPCTNLNIDILKSHVIQAQRHTLDRLQIRFYAATEPHASRMHAATREPRRFQTSSVCPQYHRVSILLTKNRFHKLNREYRLAA